MQILRNGWRGSRVRKLAVSTEEVKIQKIQKIFL